ncbi:MAG: hypothetical protein Q9186_001212 [Xanthomendoza sp. 1 TL-2023]
MLEKHKGHKTWLGDQHKGSVTEGFLEGSKDHFPKGKARKQGVGMKMEQDVLEIIKKLEAKRQEQEAELERESGAQSYHLATLKKQAQEKRKQAVERNKMKRETSDILMQEPLRKPEELWGYHGRR